MMPPLLRQALPKGQPQRLVDTIETNALRGVDIIKQMLLFSRGMAGKHIPVPLRPLLRDMLKIIRETFPKNITARSQISGELDTVSGDATQLQQVLMNLCVNARDAMPSGGTLTLGLESMDVDEAFAQTGASVTPGRYVVLTVTDTGTGIPPEVRDKIFDPFFTTKQVGQGTGLGLSTVLGIARGHNGFVEVKSEPGQGTQFRVCLPACQLAAAGGAPPKPGPLMQGQGELVLVVDDEDEVRHVTRTILERNGYRVAEAHDGVEALTFLVSGAETVQAVLTDLMMPHMDGPAFIRALPYTKTSAKVVATTGDISKLECLDELKKHVQAFLPKPFRAAELLETLARVLRA